MPHNFKLLNYANRSFISKAGNDSTTNSNNPEYPHRTIGGGSYNGGINVIVGTGQYFQDAPVNWSNNGKTFIGDGKVIINGAGNNNSPFGHGSIALINIEVTDYQNILAGVIAPYGGTSRVSVSKCIFRRGKVHVSTDSNSAYLPSLCLLSDSICFQCPVSYGDYNGGGNGRDEAVSRNIFIGSPVEAKEYVPIPVTASYFDADSPLTLPSADYLPKNCNIRGGLTIAGVSYASLADAAVAYPALLTNGNINANPGFNKPEAEDFTLRLNSIHSDKGIGPSHLRYAKMFYILFSGAPGDLCTVQNTKLANTADGSLVNFLEINGFTVNDQGGLVINPNSNNDFEAYYITDRIRCAATPQPITGLPVIFASKFNSDYPSAESVFNSRIPEVYNNNAPARNNFTSGSAGRNPHRLTVLARFSPNPSPDVLNSNDWVTNSWLEFEIGTTPTYNAVGAIGNGNPNYDTTPANVTQVVARWMQIQYRARNNYYSQ